MINSAERGGTVTWQLRAVFEREKQWTGLLLSVTMASWWSGPSSSSISQSALSFWPELEAVAPLMRFSRFCFTSFWRERWETVCMKTSYSFLFPKRMLI